MAVGLGTGSTAALFVEELGKRVRGGLKIRGVATSHVTALQAVAAGIELIELPAEGIDIAVDGADEVAPDLSLIKGGGGAHSRERIVAAAASQFVVIVDVSKLVAKLSGHVPLSMVHFGLDRTVAVVAALAAGSCELRLDADGVPRPDDDGNVLADAHFAAMGDPAQTAAALSAVPGVVAHGIFVGMARWVLVGADDGGVRELTG